MRGQIVREENQRTKNNVKEYQTQLIREMNFKTSMKYHLEVIKFFLEGPD
jgi:hypothetical protein